MTKAEIKAKIRKLKYYDSRLSEKRDEINKIEENDLKAQRRFKAETELCMKLFQVFQLNRFPKSYDYLENPTRKMTQKEARVFITSEYTKNDQFVKRDNHVFMYIPKDELAILEEVYNEMTIK